MDSKTVVNSVEQSSSMIVLHLRANTRDFLNFQIKHAQEAGFSWLKGHQGVGLASKDTGDTIASIHADGFLQSVGELVFVEIRIDPANCDAEFRAGTRLIDACTCLAKAVDGTLYDHKGRPMSAEELSAVAAHIDAVMAARFEMMWEKERKGELQPDGTRLSREDDLSFVITKRTKRGKFIETNYFDAPLQPYSDGRIHGYRMAAEMLKFIKEHKCRRVSLDRILHAVLAESEKTTVSDDYGSNLSKFGAACSFMYVMHEMITFAARHCDHNLWINDRIEGEIQSSQGLEEREKERRQAFVQRMKEARARKAAERTEAVAAPISTPKKAARPVTRKVIAQEVEA